MVRDTVAMDTRARLATALMSMRAGLNADADFFLGLFVAIVVPLRLLHYPMTGALLVEIPIRERNVLDLQWVCNLLRQTRLRVRIHRHRCHRPTAQGPSAGSGVTIRDSCIVRIRDRERQAAKGGRTNLSTARSQLIDEHPFPFFSPLFLCGRAGCRRKI